jgi:nucleoside phosphorylase/CheY-like chemotaxis protein
MISVLVVEDDAVKLRNVVSAVCEVDGFELSYIEQVTDAVRAKRMLSQKRYDVLIVDLHIPNRIDQEARADGGAELLRSMLDRDKMQVPPHIIPISAVDEARRLAEEDIGQIWGVIGYDPASTDWKNRLQRRLKHAMRSTGGDAGKPAPEIELAIVTALSEELRAFLDLEQNWTEHTLPGDPTKYHLTEFKEAGRTVKTLVACASRMGMASAASLASKVIAGFRPKYLCMGGIAAGIRGRVQLGDILVADPSWDWGSGKLEVVEGKGRFAAAPDQWRLQPDIRANLVAACEDELFLAHIRAATKGPKPIHALSGFVEAVASGAAVIGDDAVVAQIKEQHRKLHGVEMEIYGIMTAADACASPRPIAFSAKAVSDFADIHKDDSVRYYACQISANFIKKFALTYLVP